jgi:type IV pilus assembly protein PilB
MTPTETEPSAGGEGRPRKRLGEALVEKGVMTRAQLDIALEEQQLAHRPLGEILIELGFVRREQIAQHLAEDLGLDFVRARDLEPDPLLVAGLDVGFVREVGAFPIGYENGRMQVAMVDPTDGLKLQAIRSRYACELELSMLTEADLQLLVQRHLPEQRVDISGMLTPGAQGFEDESELPIERITETLFVDAIRQGATDIHLHPEEAITRVRFRLDGVLTQVEMLPRAASNGVVSRIKILSDLDISERRRPQDGRMRMRVDGRKVDLRVSVMPTVWGESVVARVLDRASGNVPLTELGISRASCRLLEHVAQHPHGLFLVTGPTGSGKTTTLYSLLAEVDALERNVATIEDPVEYNMPFVRQSQVEPAIGFDFNAGLRALLRQDPDVVLVGEIRDHETAAMAIKASMTGHLVFSTLHTNDAIGAVPRLLDLGLQPYLVEEALIGVLAQRLVRKICSSCSEEVRSTPQERAWLGKELPYLMAGRGCQRCANTGFAGRTVISELFLPTDLMAATLRSGGDVFALREAAAEAGFEEMSEDGRRKVMAGVTTAGEVLRVNRSHRVSEEERRAA